MKVDRFRNSTPHIRLKLEVYLKTCEECGCGQHYIKEIKDKTYFICTGCENKIIKTDI